MGIRIVSFVVVFIHPRGDGEHHGDDRARAPSEYATLKALGFALVTSPRGALRRSRSRIAAAGGLAGIACTFPVAAWFGTQTGTLFPVLEVSPATVAMQLAAALAVGIAAALLPGRRAARVRIVDGLRAIG